MLMASLPIGYEAWPGTTASSVGS